MGCVGLRRGVYTVQKQMPTQIHIGFCVEDSLPVSVSVSVSVLVLGSVNTPLGPL